jgi:predicted RNA binding protein YcfA (HicA-like mRNA interferase family)
VKCGVFDLVCKKCVLLFMSSREVIARLLASGWYKVRQRGSHIQFKHLKKKGRVTVVHPNRDIPIGTLRSIERQAGIRLR